MGNRISSESDDEFGNNDNPQKKIKLSTEEDVRESENIDSSQKIELLTKERENRDLSHPFQNVTIFEKNTCIKELVIGICVDTSSSTNKIFINEKDNRAQGNKKKQYTFLDIQKNIIDKMFDREKTKVYIISWNTEANEIREIADLVSTGGTNPSCLLNTKKTLQIIEKINVAIILTDGKVKAKKITRFSNLVIQKCKHLDAMIGIIVGRRTENGKTIQPSSINISVLIPAMISNGCILFHNYESTYVMWSGGVFKEEWKPVDVAETNNWNLITTIDYTKIRDIHIPICYPEDKTQLLESEYIPFGNGRFYRPDKILTYEPSWDEFLKYPFNIICPRFKMAGKCGLLLDWFLTQKNRLIAESLNLNNTNPDQNIQSFVQLRNSYLVSKYENISHNSSNVTSSYIKILNKIEAMIKNDGNNCQNETSYTVSSVADSSYTISLDEFKSEFIKVGFNQSLEWNKQYLTLCPKDKQITAECSICFEVDTIYLLLREKLDFGEDGNLKSHLLTFFYNEPMCPKCAEYFCFKQEDPVHVKCFSVLPVVNIHNNNLRKCYQDSFSQIITNPRSEAKIVSNILKFCDLLIKYYIAGGPDRYSSIITALKIIQSAYA